MSQIVHPWPNMCQIIVQLHPQSLRYVDLRTWIELRNELEADEAI